MREPSICQTDYEGFPVRSYGSPVLATHDSPVNGICVRRGRAIQDQGITDDVRSVGTVSPNLSTGDIEIQIELKGTLLVTCIAYRALPAW